MSTYTIKLRDGKYTVINHGAELRYLLDGEPWNIGVANMAHAGIVVAMAERIEELEVAIKSVLDGTPIVKKALDGTLFPTERREQNGLRSFGTQAQDIPLRRWEEALRRVLEQKP